MASSPGPRSRPPTPLSSRVTGAGGWDGGLSPLTKSAGRGHLTFTAPRAGWTSRPEIVRDAGSPEQAGLRALSLTEKQQPPPPPQHNGLQRFPGAPGWRSDTATAHTPVPLQPEPRQAVPPQAGRRDRPVPHGAPACQTAFPEEGARLQPTNAPRPRAFEATRVWGVGGGGGPGGGGGGPTRQTLFTENTWQQLSTLRKTGQRFLRPPGPENKQDIIYTLKKYLPRHHRRAA